MKRIKRFVSWMIAALVVIALQAGSIQMVYAAEGRIIIIFDETEIEVGDTVTLTMRVAGPAGEDAEADLTLTYDAEMFSFVSCSKDTYTGGPGGQLSVWGNEVSVKLRAESPGSSNLQVTGHSGMVTDGQVNLDSVTPAGITAEVRGTAGGTSGEQPSSEEGEASPGEGQDTPSEGGDGAGEPEPGIGNGQPEPTVPQISDEQSAYQEQIAQYERQLRSQQEEYQKLDEKYKQEKKVMRRTIAILVIVIVLLVILCVNIFIFMRRKVEEEGWLDKEEEEDWLDEEDDGTETAKEPEGNEPVTAAKNAEDMEVIDFNDL